MDLELSEKTFIVTGGTAGLGLAAAKCLLEEGANVLVTGRKKDKFDQAKASLPDHADKFMFVEGDNVDVGLPMRLRDTIMERWGRLDGLLVSVGGPSPSKALTTDDVVWRDAFESVFLGTVRLVRELSPIVADGGSIVLALAASAKEASMTLPLSNGFRPGLAMLAKNFAEELGSRSIRVNSLLTGGVFTTDRMKTLLKDKKAPTDTLALKRLAEPREFGRFATVLLSSVASYVTGAALSIDGGQVKSL